jgi:hypothetical protein
VGEDVINRAAETGGRSKGEPNLVEERQFAQPNARVVDAAQGREAGRAVAVLAEAGGEQGSRELTRQGWVKHRSCERSGRHSEILFDQAGHAEAHLFEWGDNLVRRTRF